MSPVYVAKKVKSEPVCVAILDIPSQSQRGLVTGVNGSCTHWAVGVLDSVLHSALEPSPMIIVEMILGIIVDAASFLTTIVVNVLGTPIIGVAVLVLAV